MDLVGQGNKFNQNVDGEINRWMYSRFIYLFIFQVDAVLFTVSHVCLFYICTMSLLVGKSVLPKSPQLTSIVLIRDLHWWSLSSLRRMLWYSKLCCQKHKSSLSFMPSCSWETHNIKFILVGLNFIWRNRGISENSLFIYEQILLTCNYSFFVCLSFSSLISKCTIFIICKPCYRVSIIANWM